jgi:hypothetical protein
MHLLNSNGEKLNVVYVTHDRFLEDLEWYVKENSSRKPATGTVELLDRVCAHILDWKLRSGDADAQAKLVFERMESNGTLQLIAQLGWPIPELVIYKFDGITTFNKFGSDDILPDGKFETFKVLTKTGATLVFSKEELEEAGGEAIPPESECDEAEIYWSSSTVHFFMKACDEEMMRSYLVRCIAELNKVYAGLGLETIAG